jgi:hypothetical protein
MALTPSSIVTRLEGGDGPDDGHILIQDLEGHRDESVGESTTALENSAGTSCRDS